MLYPTPTLLLGQICIYGVKLHVMGQSDRYDLLARRPLREEGREQQAE